LRVALEGGWSVRHAHRRPAYRQLAYRGISVAGVVHEGNPCAWGSSGSLRLFRTIVRVFEGFDRPSFAAIQGTFVWHLHDANCMRVLCGL